jgi:formylglycine-generating enzyme required for sulfatase activity
MSAYFLGKYEVTQSQWRRIMGRNEAQYRSGMTIPYSPPRDSDPPFKPFTEVHPIELVNWFAAQRFCTRLGLTLPRESQWEYACRAGTKTPWFWGVEELDLMGHENVRAQECKFVFDKSEGGYSSWNDGYPFHAPVGSFDANAFGLFDMQGNVGEWCLNPQADSWLAEGHERRFFRGGTWNMPAVPWSYSAWRNDRDASEVISWVGLRAARDIEP